MTLVALLTLLTSLVALVVAATAMIIAILDWQQVGREEPWSLTKLHGDYWRLERVHRKTVVITALSNFHGGGVQVINDAGIPVKTMRRGTQIVIRIDHSVVGTELNVISRAVKKNEVQPLLGVQAYGRLTPNKDETVWLTPIY